MIVTKVQTNALGVQDSVGVTSKQKYHRANTQINISEGSQ